MGDNWASHARLWGENGLNVHLVDQRNHGRSPHAASHTYADMVEDVRAYALEHFGERPVRWLGHSMGGKTVMALAVKYPSWWSVWPLSISVQNPIPRTTKSSSMPCTS